MADPVDSGQPGDDLLVTYLDGGLAGERRAALEARLAGDTGLKARLDALEAGGRRFAEAFDILLAAAPQERMDAALASAVGRRGHGASTPWRRLAMMAAGVALFAVGAVGGYMAPRMVPAPPQQEAAAQPNWRDAVAGYQAFLTAESMSVIAEDPAAVGQELAAVGAKLSLDLSPEKLALPHVYLKRVQLFDYWEKPLVQLAYQSPQDGPISFCIIANGQPDQPPQFEERNGFNIVFWTAGGRGYLLIGKAPRERLEALAGELATRVG
jgi:anti-sigma factor RsiW